MKCQTYPVVPGEPHLGKVRECTDTIDGEVILDKIAELAADQGFITEKTSFEIDGFEFEVGAFLDDETIELINYALENASEDVDQEALVRQVIIDNIGPIEDLEVEWSEYY